MSLDNLLDKADWADGKNRGKGWISLKPESLEGWAEEFRLAAFLADPESLAERAKEILGL
ncbi:MAG: hypothetical protein LBW85_10925 [Deltaproteobacteria bacterium]|jgi:hypothetical protein|nr:hypothetical protein [Deltaproteobacteria bacterium]